MRWFSFLTKFLFICNLCFIAGVILSLTGDDWAPQWLIGTVGVLGWIVGGLLNIIFLFLVIFFLLSGKRSLISPILTALNILIAAFQFYYLYLS